MLHGPFLISLIGWVVSKGFLFFLSLWPSCLVYSEYTVRCTSGFLYTIAFTYKKKKGWYSEERRFVSSSF